MVARLLTRRRYSWSATGRWFYRVRRSRRLKVGFRWLTAVELEKPTKS